MKKNTVLITGGSGFVGSHLVDYLLEKTNDNIVILDKIKPAQSLHKRVVYFQADIRNEKDVVDVFKKFGPFSTIYHLASAMPNKEVSNKAILKTYDAFKSK